MSEQEPVNNPAPESTETPVATPEVSQAKNDMKSLLVQLETFLDDCMVKKAPFQIPANGKEILVKIVPYLIILGLVLAVPATLLALVASPFMVLGGGTLHLIGFLFALAALVMEAVALPGLFKRAKSSWDMLFYASIVSMIGNIVSLNLVGVVLGALIGWYILFQIKVLYKA